MLISTYSFSFRSGRENILIGSLALPTRFSTYVSNTVVFSALCQIILNKLTPVFSILAICIFKEWKLLTMRKWWSKNNLTLDISWNTFWYTFVAVPFTTCFPPWKTSIGFTNIFAICPWWMTVRPDCTWTSSWKFMAVHWCWQIMTIVSYNKKISNDLH